MKKKTPNPAFKLLPSIGAEAQISRAMAALLFGPIVEKLLFSKKWKKAKRRKKSTTKKRRGKR